MTQTWDWTKTSILFAVLDPTSRDRREGCGWYGWAQGSFLKGSGHWRRAIEGWKKSRCSICRFQMNRAVWDWSNICCIVKQEAIWRVRNRRGECYSDPPAIRTGFPSPQCKKTCMMRGKQIWNKWGRLYSTSYARFFLLKCSAYLLSVTSCLHVLSSVIIHGSHRFSSFWSD